MFSGINLGAISVGMPMNFIHNMCLEIPILKLLPHLPGANELKKKNNNNNNNSNNSNTGHCSKHSAVLYGG